MSLKDLIISEINNSGPITISRFMEHCLYNKKFGYYGSKKNTIGTTGDFITSPEISQVFGELIAIWLAQTWIDRGKPNPFSLVELGPGNGTMMRDVLNTLAKISGFTDSASIVLVETSEILQSRQRSVLKDHRPIWIKKVSDIPEQPLFLFANEFLDALPIRQFKKRNDIWYERSVGLDKNNELRFIFIPSNFHKELNLLYRDIPNNIIIEKSDIMTNILSNLSEKIFRNGGVCLFIDYGYFDGVGETLQAVNQHNFAEPLANLGETDLTAHVNFKTIYTLIRRKGLRASHLKNQRNFLMGLGIKHRSEVLAKNLSPTKKKIHLSAINRLIHKDQMGDLFKVMGMTNQESPALPVLE